MPESPRPVPAVWTPLTPHSSVNSTEFKCDYASLAAHDRAVRGGIREDDLGGFPLDGNAQIGLVVLSSLHGFDGPAQTTNMQTSQSS